jgi:hypothetical protein
MDERSPGSMKTTKLYENLIQLVENLIPLVENLVPVVENLKHLIC